VSSSRSPVEPRDVEDVEEVRLTGEGVRATTLSEAVADGRTPDDHSAGGRSTSSDRLKEALDDPRACLNTPQRRGLDGFARRHGPRRRPARHARAPSPSRNRARALPGSRRRGDARRRRRRSQRRSTAGGTSCSDRAAGTSGTSGSPASRRGGAECFAQEGENEYHAIFANDTCAAVHGPRRSASPSSPSTPRSGISPGEGTRTVPLEGFFTPASIDVPAENALRGGRDPDPHPRSGDLGRTTSAYVRSPRRNRRTGLSPSRGRPRPAGHGRPARLDRAGGGGVTPPAREGSRGGFSRGKVVTERRPRRRPRGGGGRDAASGQRLQDSDLRDGRERAILAAAA